MCMQGDNAPPKSQILSNKYISTRQWKSPLKLIFHGVQETPKPM